MNIKEVANKIFIDFSETEIKEVTKQIGILNEEVEYLNTIDTSMVEAMDLPFELNENEIRFDTVGEVLTVEELLENAPDKSEDYVRIVKVVG